MSSRQSLKRYVCPHCDKSYGKAEHLIRHERSHSGSRPFVCEQCDRHFTRPDSLARHTKRHTHEANRRLQSPINTPRGNGMLSISQMMDNGQAPVMPSLNEPSTYPPVSEYHSATQGLPLENESFVSLNWPDSADLLNSILSAEFTSLPSLEILPSQSLVRGGQELESQPVSPWLTPDTNQGQVHGGNHAVQNLSQIISTLSADVTSEAQSTGFTSVFLDGCLHMFFTEFVPAFPVVHRPTFVFKDWTHPLLLNAIALGSLFMGKRDYIFKGEVLWRLAHTAVATSWHTLIKHRGPYDSCSGVQLVLTALLGQVYATLSQNVTLRMTAQVFHSLGFYWARETGMYDLEEDNDGPSLDALQSDEMDEHQWRAWAAKETQLRALLGHYILDGQLSEYTGGPTCQRHTSHSLPMPSEDSIFEAQNASTWKEKIISRRCKQFHFSDVFRSIFSENVHIRHMGTSLSSFSASVLLEGLKSFVAEKINIGSTVVGVPSSRELSRALGRLHGFILQSTSMSTVEKQVTLLRWHTICLDAAVNFNWLCRGLCRKYLVEQRIIGGRKTPNLDLELWVQSPKSHLGLLHATCMLRILQELPIRQAQIIHVPAAVFSAGIMYCAFLLGGVSNIAVPDATDWESVMLMDLETPEETFQDELDSDVRHYLNGTYADDANIKSIMYDLSTFSRSLKNLEQLWGVSTHMVGVLDELSSHYG